MTFIFQAKPAIYLLEEKLEVGKEVGWLASRYRDRMHKDDIVYYWRAGDKDKRGIYGRGYITSNGAFIDRKGTYRVAVTCKEIFQNHITIARILAHPILSEMTIVRSAMGTNFILTDEESNALSALVEEIFGIKKAP